MEISGRIFEELCILAEKHGIQKVILFGSRARGDCGSRSDIDLAVSGGNGVLFSLEAEEAVSTLLKLDIVDLDGAVQQELRESIQKEGIVLYEKIR